VRSIAATVATSTLLGLAIAESGCVDTSSPSGAAAISAITFPSPSVVVGDVMRDSLGAPAPVRVAAFDGAGNPIVNATITFVALTPTIAIDADGTLHGLALDSLGAQLVAGVGSLQGPIARIFVTVKPDQVTGGGNVANLTFPKNGGQGPADSLVTSLPLTVTVTNALTAHGAQGIIVTFDVVSAPLALSTALPTTFVADDIGRVSQRDTTDIRGVASRHVVLLHRRLGDAGLLNGTSIDSIVVRATVRYGGFDLPGTPLVFKIPVTRQP
jgi:hypothetical protein